MMSTILRKVTFMSAAAVGILILNSSVDNAMITSKSKPITITTSKPITITTSKPITVAMKIDTTKPIIAERVNAISVSSPVNKIYPKGLIIEIMGEPAPLMIIEVEEIPDISPPTIDRPTGPVDEYTVLNKFVEGRSTHERNEIHCLALNTFHEAARETYVGKLAVANVTQTRVNDKRWPGTFCGVVKEGYVPGKKWGCQFSWNCDFRSDKVYMHSKTKNGRVLRTDIYASWVESVKIAVEVFDNKATDVTAGATHYYNPAICYKWSIRVDKHGNRLIAKTHKDFVGRVKPQTVACHSKWGYKGLREGSFIRTPSTFATNGMIDSHLFLIERAPGQLAGK